MQAEQALQERQAQAATRERQALKADLERVLRERGRFESLKHLVVTALGSTQQQSQQQSQQQEAATRHGLSEQQHQQVEAVQGLQPGASGSRGQLDRARLIGNVQA